MNKTKTNFKQLFLVTFALISSLALMQTKKIETPIALPIVEPVRMHEPNLNDFMKAIAKFESNNNSRAINYSTNMLGKYQFSSTTLQRLGIYDRTKFLMSDSLQDSVMRLNIRSNFLSLKNVITRWNGKVKNGIRITPSGVIAGAHLVGVKGVLTFFYPEQYQYRTMDENGTTVGYYLKQFGGYKLTYRGI